MQTLSELFLNVINFSRITEGVAGNYQYQLKIMSGVKPN
jgi:hypothetical protein